MPYEDIDPNNIYFKELGSLQEKIVFFIAENPKNHKQAIQKGIEHPNEQYGSVLNAVNTIEKLGYIESKEVLSQKKVKIKEYKCTELGVFYTLARNRYANIPKILDNYQNEIEICKQFKAIYKVWGQDQFALFLKSLGDFLPMVQNNGVDYAVPYLLMKIAQQADKIDPKTRKKNFKEALKQFPETKKMLKEWQKNMKEVL